LKATVGIYQTISIFCKIKAEWYILKYMSGNPSLKKVKLKRWELTKAVMEIIFLGLISGGGSWTRPTLPLMIRAIIEALKEYKKLNIEEMKVRRILKNLEKREILDLYEKDGNVYVKSLNKNNSTLIKYSLKPILDFKQRNKKWTGKWYLVFFDVPEIQRNKRNYLRLFLKKLGFYPYQKSVYLFPYECEEEIKLIKKIVEGGKYIKYIIAEKIEDEFEVKRFFQLSQ